MTQEEKARAYDEALERAKFYHGNCPSEPERKKLEEMFPKLRESENERIRKELVEYLTVTRQSDFVSRPDRQRWIEYLEKQKEQKPSDFPAGFYVTLPDGKKYYTKEMRCKGMNIKVVEPKPAEWSEEDEKMLNSVIRLISHFDDLAHEPTYAGPKWTHPYTKELKFLEKLRNRLFEENN